jgi:hypothetical protein
VRDRLPNEIIAKRGVTFLRHIYSMIVAFIIWVAAVAAVAIFGQGALAPAALAILGACGGMLTFGPGRRR